jgi:putative lipoic acid-binding regulatory protein
MTTNLNDDAFSKAINFPATITFKFIGENNTQFKKNVENFFTQELNLSVNIKEGKQSKTGKYLTLNVTVKVADSVCMNKVYSEGAKVPLVLHIL